MPEGLPGFDWIVIGLYLGAVLLVGLHASGRQRTTRDYFLGDRRIPWWAASLSVVATETSAVTIIGLPGMAYRHDWYFLQIVAGFALARVFLALFFVKYYYRHDLTTVYGFLETRFGGPTRLIAASLFLFGRVLASAVRLYAACLAVQVATGLSIQWSIGILGILGVAYTLSGGIRAVIWTDCILGLTFIASGIVALVFIVSQVDGGLAAIVRQLNPEGKLRIFHGGAGDGWRAFFASDRPIAIGLLGGFVLTLATHGTDQDIVQRVLTCEDDRSGGRSLIASAVLILPLFVLFLAVGSALWFYHGQSGGPPAIPPGVAGNPEDYYFPIFVAEHIPLGVRGVIFAGIFAAALSSLTSVLNALAATTVTDFYRPMMRRPAEERHLLRVARVSTFLWGLALVGVAWLFIGSGKGVMLVAMRALTYFYGSLLGVFLVGMFTLRGSVLSTILGMLAAVPCVLALQLRAFLQNEQSAPDIIRELLGAIPADLRHGILSTVPNLSWPLWTVVGALVTFSVGILGTSTIARRG